jgi:hypothetical protein
MSTVHPERLPLVTSPPGMLCATWNGWFLSWLEMRNAPIASKSTICPPASEVGAPATGGSNVRFVPSTAPTMRYGMDSSFKSARRVVNGEMA